MALHDVAIVGAGPVGLACALEASRQGLSHVVLERGSLLESIRRFPTYTVFFSTPDLLEIGGFPFVCAGPKPTRKEALVYYRKVAERGSLNLHLGEEVLGVRRGGEHLDVVTLRAVHTARAVVVATGFLDNPNLLGVPGEGLAKVSHYYTEPFAYAQRDVLIVGGKNSAAEAALDLHRNGARVTMAVRGPAFGASLKYWLKPDIENRVKEGSIRAHFQTRVESIEADTVTLSENGRRFTIANDAVLALTGYHPDYGFLSRAGIELTEDRRVVHDPDTMETRVPGLYVAGVVAAGREIGKLFIENGRLHAAQIVKHLLARLRRDPVEGPIAPPLKRFQDGD